MNLSPSEKDLILFWILVYHNKEQKSNVGQELMRVNEDGAKRLIKTGNALMKKFTSFTNEAKSPVS